MAWIWMMSVNCGTEETAEQFRSEFDGSDIILGPAQIRLDIGQSYLYDEEWYVDAVPHLGEEISTPHTCLCAHGGASDRDEADLMTACGHVLYERMRKCTAPYLFGQVATECAEWRNSEEVGEVLDYDGLVVATSIWEKAGKPPNFIEFSPGHLWIPWEGEKPCVP